jgi:hypothetical protein
VTAISFAVIKLYRMLLFSRGQRFVMCLTGLCLLFVSCNTATPERYFDLAVLNANMINGISNDGSMSDLVYPSAKLVEGTKDQSVPMKRKEMLDQKVQFLDENLGKLKKLKETADTKEMVQTSIALNEYVLAIYKNEYRQMAALYDEGAEKEKIQALGLAIHDKYYPRYEQLFNKLISIGKSYAAKHKIEVNWGAGH